MSNVSLENLVILTQDPIGQNDGISNTAFETNEDENSDLEIGFLENLNFEDSAEETSEDDRFADVKTGDKDKPLVKENNKESTLVCERQPAQSKGNVIPENLTPAKSEDNQTLEQVKEQKQTNGNSLNKIKDPPVLSRNSSNAVVQRKQPLKGSADGIAISKDYVWGPLFQELPYKTVTFNPHHAIRPDPYTQGIIRNRKPQVLVDRQKQGPIKRYNSNASQSEEDESKWHHVTRDIIQAIFVRLLLVCHSFLCVWRAVDVKKDDLYWCLALTNVVLVIETIYTIVKRQGRDPKWICPCFVIYLGGTVPALWFLQIDKLDRYNEAMSGNVSNLTDSLQEALSSIEGVQIPIYLDPDTWVAILEQILLFVLVVGRMLLPLGALSREELSQLLFIFIGSGSDVMELFVVFDEPQFRTNSPLKFATLTVWSVSLLQFTFVLTAAKSPKKIRLGTTEDKYHSVKEKRATFGIEILSLLISFLLMDGPYCALRLYAIIVYKNSLVGETNLIFCHRTKKSRYNSVIEGRVFSCRLHIYIERMSFEAALVLFGCTALIHIVNGASTEEYKRLQKSLMVNYSTSVRPVLDQNRPVLVNTALYLSGIDEVDAVGQRLVTSTVLEVTWLDEFLRWDLNSTGIQTLHFKQKDIWTPDLVLKNGVKKIEQLGGDFYYLKVTSDGYVRWLPFQVFESKCDVDITYFPYDDQFCDIVIHSWSFIKQEVNVTLFENDSTPVDYYSYVKNSVWDIVSTNAYASPDSSEESEVTFSFWLRRKPLYYINNLIVPMALQGVISLMVFVIPADAGEKMSFAMTVFLSFVVFLSIISTHLPTNSEKIPILGVYIIIQMTKGVVIIIISSFQVRVHHRKSERKVGRFYREIIRFERFLRCKNCSSKCSKHKGRESENYLDRIDWNDVSSAIDFVSFWIMLIFEILVFTIIMVKIQESSV